MKNILRLMILGFGLMVFTACPGASEELNRENTANESTENNESTTPAEPADEKPEAESSGAATPTEAVRTFAAGLKDKDPEKVKSVLTANSLKMLEGGASANNMSVDEFIKSGKASEGMKEIEEYRNEKIDGDAASVETLHDGKWEPVNLVEEDGGWKLALDKR
jgi:hypothetical protein